MREEGRGSGSDRLWQLIKKVVPHSFFIEAVAPLPQPLII